MVDSLHGVAWRGETFGLARRTGAPMSRAPVIIEHSASESHRYPGFHRGSQRVVVARAMPYLEKDVVNDVLGIGRPQPEPPSKTEEPPRVPIVELTHRRTIAVGHTGDEGFVGRVVLAQGALRSAVTDGVVP